MIRRRGLGTWRRVRGRINPEASDVRRPGYRAGTVLAVLAALAVLALPRPGSAQAPDQVWRTLETEHFRVTFPEHLEGLGRKSADRAERAWEELRRHFIEPPEGKVDILVTDHSDVSNGFAQVTPSNRVTIHARPPVDAPSLGYMDDWLELVITHELAHIVHLDHVLNPLGRLGRGVFGRVPSEWPTFPELATPRWVLEGLATWYESRLTQAGREDGTFLDMQIRTAALEGRFEDIGQASGDAPLWPGGNRSYAYGTTFFRHLLEEHGEDGMAAFADAVAAQWIPYRLDAAGEDAFGVALSDEWERWKRSVRDDLDDLDAELAELGPVTEAERLTHQARWALHPTASPDGRYVAYARSDGRSDMQIHLLDLDSGASRSLGRTNGLATFSWRSDDELLVSQLELEGPYRSYDDLYLYGLDGRQTRLTRGARLTQPWASADGSFAVAVRQGEGSNELVRIDLDSLEVRTLVPASEDVHWAFPALSPDGRWIAVSRWLPNARHDVVILDAESGREVAQVTADRALDLAPRWSSDGRWVVWGSDRTGIPNVLAARFQPDQGRVSEPRLLTNVRTGVAYPSVDPSGSWLYFAGHHVDGWEVERVPFHPDQAEAAPAPRSRFELEGEPPVRGAHGGSVGPYRAWHTLRPYYWELSYQDPVETPSIVADGLFLRRRELLGFGIGIQTAGRDLVGRHGYGAALRVSTTGGKVDGSVSYRYAGLGTPVLSLSASQSFRDGGQQLAGPDADTLLVLERRRAVEGAATFLLPTWRRNLAFTVSTGMVWEDRELLDARLEPAEGFQLARPTSRLWDVTGSVNVVTARSHSFQMGTSEGLALFLLGRVQSELAVPDSVSGVAGFDRSVQEGLGRLRGALPLGRAGYARHLLAFRLSGGIAGGPGADAFHYRVGGATGRPEPLTGLELFGGRSFFFPVRGYDPSTRFGRYAWSAALEYRIPLWLLNRGFGAWPLHLDRTMAALFVDAGNAWGPDVSPGGFANPTRSPIASAGAEVTVELLGFFDVRARLRTGVAVPLVSANPVVGRPGPGVYLRVGLPF